MHLAARSSLDLQTFRFDADLPLHGITKSGKRRQGSTEGDQRDDHHHAESDRRSAGTTDAASPAKAIVVKVIAATTTVELSMLLAAKGRGWALAWVAG